MKTTIKILGMAMLIAALYNIGCAQKQPVLWQSIKNPEVTAQLKSFVVEKEAQANAATNKMPSEFKFFFAAANKGDWLTVSNDFENFRKHSHDFDHPGPNDEWLQGVQWQAVKEVWGAFAAFAWGDEKYCAAFGRDIIESIPPGSIYFGGSDPGRFLITAMQKSQVDGDPFFTLTQNALADGTYLDYLRSMYGDKIYIPTSKDLQKCYEDYMADAKQRLQNHQLKPGEDVKVTGDGLVQISGQVAVMQINGLLTKIIFDRNSNREFYVEESFPLDWMYPYLEPHGLIMKINRQPLAELPGDIVNQDHDYWTNCVTPMIGGWLNDDASVSDVAAFVEKVYLRHNFSGFDGDPRFVQNAYSHTMFSKERSSIAGLYAWRAQHASDATEKERMNNEADFAFRQAWALCPYSPEAVFRFVNLLLSQNRVSDALVVAETAAKFPSTTGIDVRQMQNLVDQLKRFQKTKSF